MAALGASRAKVISYSPRGAMSLRDVQQVLGNPKLRGKAVFETLPACAIALLVSVECWRAGTRGPALGGYALAVTVLLSVLRANFVARRTLHPDARRFWPKVGVFVLVLSLWCVLYFFVLR